MVRALASGAFALLAIGLLALFAPDVLPFPVEKEIAYALIATGAALELWSVALVIRALRKHGRERLQSVLQQAKTKEKP